MPALKPEPFLAFDAPAPAALGLTVLRPAEAASRSGPPPTTWADVSAHVSQRFAALMRPTPAINRFAEELLQLHPHRADRLRATARRVQELPLNPVPIDLHQPPRDWPQSAHETWERGYGDSAEKALLVCALLRA